MYHFWHETPERIVQLKGMGMSTYINSATINGQVENYTMCADNRYAYDKLEKQGLIVYLGTGSFDSIELVPKEKRRK